MPRWSLVCLGADFSRGLAIPPRMKLLRDGMSVDLRIPARKMGAQRVFWEHFCCYAFSRVEMRAAITRIVPRRDQGDLLRKVDNPSDIPNEVGQDFATLIEQFASVTMSICRDPECGHGPAKHAHGYQRGDIIPGAVFQSTDEARAWIDTNRWIDGANARSLRTRIRDWPGMLDTVTAGHAPLDTTLERQTA